MNNKLPPTAQSGEMLLYQTEDGQTRLEVRLFNETVWLTQKKMAELFQKNVRTINEHIKNIFAEGELKAESVIRNFRITADDGKNEQAQWPAPTRCENGMIGDGALHQVARRHYPYVDVVRHYYDT